MSLGLAAAGSPEQYLDIVSTIEAGLEEDISPHELADQLARPYYEMGEESNPAFATAHFLLGQIVSGRSHEGTRERLQLALDVIPPSVELAQLDAAERERGSSDYARSDTIMSPSETPIDSIPVSAAPAVRATKPASALSKDLRLISDSDNENEMQFLSEVLSVKKGPLADDAQFLAGLNPGDDIENTDLNNGFVRSGTSLNTSVTRIMIELLRNEFAIPENPGSMPDRAKANDVRLKAALMPGTTLRGTWKLDLEIDFELEVADPNYLLMIMLSKHHSVYRAAPEKVIDEAGNEVERDSTTKIRVNVHYQGDVVIGAHEIRMKLRLVEDKKIEKGWTREEFGDLELIVVPRGLALIMENKPFSVNPNNFVKAMRKGIEKSLMTDAEARFQTLPSRTEPSAADDTA